MKKENNNILEYSVYLFAAVLVTVVGLFTPQFAFQATDDSTLVFDILNDTGAQNQTVLGANSTSADPTPCPAEKPVVGWLSFQGDKVLPTKLPPGEEPSVCFESYEAAYAEGFVHQK